jgi:hypothetical protein
MKKIIYILAAIILGLLLSLILHSVVEIYYLNSLATNGRFVETHTWLELNCYLPPIWQLFFIIGGASGGFWLGQTWWRIVYIEKRHWRMKKNK